MWYWGSGSPEEVSCKLKKNITRFHTAGVLLVSGRLSIAICIYKGIDGEASVGIFGRKKKKKREQLEAKLDCEIFCTVAGGHTSSVETRCGPPLSQRWLESLPSCEAPGTLMQIRKYFNEFRYWVNWHLNPERNTENKEWQRNPFISKVYVYSYISIQIVLWPVRPLHSGMLVCFTKITGPITRT